MQTQLSSHLEVRGGAVVVRFEGDVDIAVGYEFKSQLKAALDAASTIPGRPLIIDMQDVAFFGTSGLKDLFACHKNGAADGVAVALVAASPIVVHLIEAAGLGEVLTLRPTIEDALRSVDWVMPG